MDPVFVEPEDGIVIVTVSELFEATSVCDVVVRLAVLLMGGLPALLTVVVTVMVTTLVTPRSPPRVTTME